MEFSKLERIYSWNYAKITIFFIKSRFVKKHKKSIQILKNGPIDPKIKIQRCPAWIVNSGLSLFFISIFFAILWTNVTLSGTIIVPLRVTFAHKIAKKIDIKKRLNPELTIHAGHLCINFWVNWTIFGDLYRLFLCIFHKSRFYKKIEIFV